MIGGRTVHPISLPRRQRNYSFALTPLADAMFQLLVFFMLSSNLSPYSLLPLRAGALAAPGEAPAAIDGPEATPMAAGDTAIWSVSRDSIVAGGQRFGFDRLPDLAGAVQAAGTARVLLITRSEAQVQGVVSVLEALAARGVTDVQIAAAPATRGSAQP